MKYPAPDSLHSFPSQGNEKGVVVFVHGAWHGGWCWEEKLTGIFTRKGYRCVTFDLPLHSKPGENKEMEKLRMADYVDCLRHVVEKTEGHPILIGHSMGATIIQHYLAKYSCRMAVMMAAPPPDGIWRSVLRLMLRPYIWKSILRRRLFLPVSNLKRASWMLFGHSIPEEKAQQYSSRLCDESYPVIRQMLRIHQPNQWDQRTPVLFFGAGKDRLISINDLHRSANYYKAGLVIIPGMGHDMMLEEHASQMTDIMINCIETRLGITKGNAPTLEPLVQGSPSMFDKIETEGDRRFW